jgi:RNA polymerase sigma factor (sigma-70 family)
MDSLPADGAWAATLESSRELERDPAFLQRLVARERDALGRYYELFFDRIYGYVRRLVGDEHISEDVTQDVFMHIQRSLTSYDPTRELAPWVFTIATNKVRDLWRSRRHSDRSVESSLDDEGAELAQAAVDVQRAPLPELEREELRNTLERAIAELPAGLRSAFVLRWQERLSFEAIGAILQRNEVAARKRYSRALIELRAALEKHARSARGGVT